MKKEKETIKEYKILSVDAADLYGSIYEKKAFSICDEKGGVDFKRFTASIYNSLETKKLKAVYAKEKERRR